MQEKESNHGKHGNTRKKFLICSALWLSFGKIIIELKAARAIAPEHRAQIINYLRATEMKLGLLVNFGATPRAEIERFAL